MTSNQRGACIVIGAGVAGLLAARVLSDHFTSVVVMDRDELDRGAQARRCIQQGHHVHLLLANGFRILTRLLPGFAEELVAEGAAPFDIGQELEYWRRGRLKQPFDRGLGTLAVSRPALEAVLRRRVALLPNVQLRGRCSVARLDSVEGRVIGVELEGGARAAADWVVDAGGRGSRVRRWLDEIGCPTPTSTEIELGLAYASRVVRLARDPARRWRMLYVGPSAGSWSRGGAILRVEGERAMVTLAGYVHDHPALDDDGFGEFAASVGVEFETALRGAELLGRARRFNVPAMVRHHFEDLKLHPEGLLAVGDAICLLDPCFGQGMTVAAEQASLLDGLLRRVAPLARIPAAFYRGAKAIIDSAWTPTASENFHRPGVTGARPAGLGAIQWYSGHAMGLSDRDPEIHRALQESFHRVSGPLALLRPGLLSKVLGHAARRER